MATPGEKLAHSLRALQGLQDAGIVAIRSRDLPRLHRERLLANGFLHEVMKGWYIPTRPDEPPGESTAWYGSFWRFCAAYLHERFGDRWCLAPEHSLSLHAGRWTVPSQLVVRAPKGGNSVIGLPHGTSLLDVRASVPAEADGSDLQGLRAYALPAALVACGPGYFAHSPTEARAALCAVRDASDLLTRLLEGGHTTIAGRLAGAFRNIGRDRIADELVKTMRSAGYDTRERDPFASRPPVLPDAREVSPHVNRLRLLWAAMRERIAGRFPDAPGLPGDAAAYIARVEEVSVTDAYHSLSIEGYRVSPALIERVRTGQWQPAGEEDRGHRDALAARGYYQGFLAVEASLRRVLAGELPGPVVEEDHRAWYRELFAPSAVAGLVRPADLAGYRSGPVYIRNSKHVPPSREAVRDLMPAFFECLEGEPDPAVRIVLGHFLFVYIHPYADGNGRMARFVMNVMLAAGGYPWVVVPVQAREQYMAALEIASVRENIGPFADFLARLVDASMKGAPAPALA